VFLESVGLLTKQTLSVPHNAREVSRGGLGGGGAVLHWGGACGPQRGFAHCSCSMVARVLAHNGAQPLPRLAQFEQSFLLEGRFGLGGSHATLPPLAPSPLHGHIVASQSLAHPPPVMPKVPALSGGKP